MAKNYERGGHNFKPNMAENYEQKTGEQQSFLAKDDKNHWGEKQVFKPNMAKIDELPTVYEFNIFYIIQNDEIYEVLKPIYTMAFDV